MGRSAQATQRFLAEALDSRRTVLICGRHQYSPGGPKMPASNCSDCWFAFLFHHIGKLPPDMRREKLEELEMVIRHAVEHEDRGELDFEPYAHPKIESIEKE